MNFLLLFCIIKCENNFCVSLLSLVPLYLTKKYIKPSYFICIVRFGVFWLIQKYVCCLPICMYGKCLYRTSIVILKLSIWLLTYDAEAIYILFLMFIIMLRHITELKSGQHHQMTGTYAPHLPFSTFSWEKFFHNHKE